MRKKDDRLRENLLKIACETADKEGIKGVNIRNIAKKAGVAAGTVYNYFSGKEEILLEITEWYWQAAFREMTGCVKASDFCGQTEEIFRFLKDKMLSSGGKLMSSLEGNAKQLGEGRMATAQSKLADIFKKLLDTDEEISPEIWKDNFTKEKFAEFIMSNIICALRSGQDNIDFLILIIKRVLY